MNRNKQMGYPTPRATTGPATAHNVSRKGESQDQAGRRVRDFKRGVARGNGGNPYDSG